MNQTPATPRTRRELIRELLGYLLHYRNPILEGDITKVQAFVDGVIEAIPKEREAARSEKPATVSGPFRVGEPEDEDDSSTVLGAKGEALTADEIVTWLNYFYGKAHALELDVQAIARNRDEYRERAYEAERKL